MSAAAALDEDTELRDLVAQTLEANGVLGKIRVRIYYAAWTVLTTRDMFEQI